MAIANFESFYSAFASRQYPSASLILRKELRQRPHEFLDLKDWSQLFSGIEWFATLDEPEEYLQYATEVATDLADYVDGLTDRVLATALASAFVHGAHFRLTANSNGDPRPVMKARARLFGVVLATLPVDREFRFLTPASSAKPRLAVLFKHLHSDPETNSVLPFFEHVKSQGIEVLLFVGSDRIDPNFFKYVVSCCDQVYRLPDDLGAAVTQLRQANIDILLFGNDISAKPSAFAFLSFFKIARITASCVCSLITTTSAAINAYFGCKYYKDVGFDKQFDEQFILMPDPGYSFSYPFRVTTDVPVPITRQQLNLQPDSVLLVSGANQTKLHRGMLEVWARILQRNPKAVLLLYPFPPHFGGTREAVSQRVLGHFAEFGIPPGRVAIADSIPGRDLVMSMLKNTADLGLDSFPFTGVTTVVDSIDAGLPTISLKGKSLRSSQGAAILHAAGFDDLVVNTVDEYVDLASRLIADTALRQSIKARMNQASRDIPVFLRPQEFSKKAADIYRGLHKELADGAYVGKASHL